MGNQDAKPKGVKQSFHRTLPFRSDEVRADDTDISRFSSSKMLFIKVQYFALLDDGALFPRVYISRTVV